MEAPQKERIQKLTNITYSMITNITSIENSLSNISMMLGKGGLSKPYQQGSAYSPPEAETAAQEKKTDTVLQNRIPSYHEDEKYTGLPESTEETHKRGSGELKEELEKLNSMTLIPQEKRTANVNEEMELPETQQELYGNQSKVNPNLKKELSELEGRFGLKAAKSSKTAQKEPAKPQETEPQTYPSTNPMEALIALVNERKTISVSEAAKTLNFDASLIETWAKLLSDNNKIKLEYKIIGNPILKAK
ncbi:MAG: hypothetical protein OH316_01030 [Candidatus Parvarchaeota archaeon]|nr:hypothetical protein [Candidatus Parvarchaeota archaeon]MCW1301705.1 hypothetical protein [Candidatus Parvarchaeota archaeon]